MGKTREVLAEMLKENTGTAMCDSGGYPQYSKDGCYINSDYGNGRNWEKNGCRDLERETPVSLDFRYGYVDFTHSLYHWLVERLEYDQDMNDLFDAFADESPEGETWYSLISRFSEHLTGLGFEVGGIYGEGKPIHVNTFNSEDLLSQVIQFTYFTLKGWVEEGPGINVSEGVYIVLQIHGGCDVRGGYTKPRIFRANDLCGEEAVLMNAHGYISTENGEYSWYTDDGYHWYGDGCSTSDDLTSGNLEDKKIVDSDDFSGQITITHSTLNPNPALPGLDECRWGTEELIIKDVPPEHAQELADGFADIFNAYCQLFPEIHATHDLDEDVILVDGLGQGYYRGSKLEGY